MSRVPTTLSTDEKPPVQPSGDSLDDIYSTADIQIHTSGKVYGAVSFTANFVATYNPDIQGTVGLLDGIVQIEPSDFFNVWLGRMLVPSWSEDFAGFIRILSTALAQADGIDAEAGRVGSCAGERRHRLCGAQSQRTA